MRRVFGRWWRASSGGGRGARLRAGPVHRWRYVGRTPERVLIAPPDLRLADPQIALEIYYGRFPLAGHLVETGGQVAVPGSTSPIARPGKPRCMASAGCAICAPPAPSSPPPMRRALVGDWIVIAWRACWQVRLGAGHHGAGASLPGCSIPRSCCRARNSRSTAPSCSRSPCRSAILRSAATDMPDGEERLRARIALAFAALSLPVPPSALRAATRNLAERARAADPAGWRPHLAQPRWRCSSCWPISCRCARPMPTRPKTPPDALIHAIDRMLPALRFFRHQDGALPASTAWARPSRTASPPSCATTTSAAAPLLHAPHSGYERLAIGGTTVIADTGAGAAGRGLAATPMPAACRSRCPPAAITSSSIAGVDAFGPDDFRPLGARHRRHIRPPPSTTPRRRASVTRPASTGCCARRWSPVRARCAPPAAMPPTATASSPAMTAMSPASASSTNASFTFPRAAICSPGSIVSTVPAANRRATMAATWSRCAFTFTRTSRSTATATDRFVLAAGGADSWSFACDPVAAAIEESIFFAGLARSSPQQPDCRQFQGLSHARGRLAAGHGSAPSSGRRKASAGSAKADRGLVAIRRSALPFQHGSLPAPACASGKLTQCGRTSSWPSRRNRFPRPIWSGSGGR